MNTQTSKCELTFANAMHQLDAGNRDGRVSESLEPEHRTDALFDGSMILFDQVAQIFGRTYPSVGGLGDVGLELAHRTVRRRVAVERDGLRPGPGS